MIWAHFIDFDGIMEIEWKSIFIFVFVCEMQSGVGPESKISDFFPAIAAALSGRKTSFRNRKLGFWAMPLKPPLDYGILRKSRAFEEFLLQIASGRPSGGHVDDNFPWVWRDPGGPGWVKS